MDRETLDVHMLAIPFGESSPYLAVRSSYCPGFMKGSSEFQKSKISFWDRTSRETVNS